MATAEEEEEEEEEKEEEPGGATGVWRGKTVTDLVYEGSLLLIA